MTTLTTKLVQTVAAAAVALTGFASFAAAPASAYGYHRDDFDHRVVRCDRDRDTCVVYRCDRDDDDCIRVRVIHRGRGEGWRREFGYRFDERGWEDGGFIWYGRDHVHCNRFGEHCRRF